MKSFIAIACLLPMMAYAGYTTTTPPAGPVGECCKIILMNWDDGGSNHTYLNQLSGTRNGQPKWSCREGGDSDSIYYENGKWIIGGERQPWAISNTSPKC